jgi:antitoxin (DNA-binding transcriptional repressor) of toxin-antitoxin stability system
MAGEGCKHGNAIALLLPRGSRHTPQREDAEQEEKESLGGAQTERLKESQEHDRKNDDNDPVPTR